MGETKNWDTLFKICKYTFVKYLKRESAKNWAGFFKLRKYTFLIYEKEDKQKIGPGFVRFGSTLLLYISK